MKKRLSIPTMAFLLFAACTGHPSSTGSSPPAPTAQVPRGPWSRALAYSDFVVVCEVLREEPLVREGDYVRKSYEVALRDWLYVGLLGVDIPGEISIRFDSEEYTEVERSGLEHEFRQGDSFIAFLDFVHEEPEFRIVRLDLIERKSEIEESIEAFLAARAKAAGFGWE